MANQIQWSQVLQFGLFGDVRSFYKKKCFPTTIRMVNPYWLENYIRQLEKVANPDNPAHAAHFDQFMQEFFHALNTAANQAVENGYSTQNNQSLTFGIEHELQAEVKELATKYRYNSIGLFRIIKSCLDYESSLILQKTNPVNSPERRDTSYERDAQRKLNQSALYAQVDQQLSTILSSEGTGIGSTETEISKLTTIHSQLQESICHYNFWMSNNTMMIHPEQWQVRANEKMEAIRYYLIDISSKTNEVLKTLIKIRDESVLRFLHEWEIGTRRAQYGAPIFHELEEIAGLANSVARILVELYKLLKFEDVNDVLKQAPLQPFNTLQSLLERVKSEIISLVTSTFIVEKQPPQMLYFKQKKCDIKSSIVVRLLVGGTINQNTVSHIEVILTDKQKIVDITSTNTQMGYNNKFTADIKIIMPANRTYATDRESVSEEDNSQNRKTKKKVTENKYAFYFSSSFQCSDLDISHFEIKTQSFPVMVLSTPNQEILAWPTILWWNAFAKENSMEDEDEVSCEELMDVLSLYFLKYTGRHLSAVNREMLSHKLMGDISCPITREMFSEPKSDGLGNDKLAKLLKPLPNGKFKEFPATFSSWLFTIIEMCDPSNTDSNIAQFWKEGKIIGFMTKQKITESLMSSRDGTFCIYFSEILIGGLTIARYDRKEQSLQRLEPFRTDGPIALDKHLGKNAYLQYLLQIEDNTSKNVEKSEAFPNRSDEDKENYLTKIQRELWIKGYTILYQNQNLQNLYPPPTKTLRATLSPSFPDPNQGTSRKMSSGIHLQR